MNFIILIYFNRAFHYKPSILGYLYFLETPIWQILATNGQTFPDWSGNLEGSIFSDHPSLGGCLRLLDMFFAVKFGERFHVGPICCFFFNVPCWTHHLDVCWINFYRCQVMDLYPQSFRNGATPFDKYVYNYFKDLIHHSKQTCLRQWICWDTFVLVEIQYETHTLGILAHLLRMVSWNLNTMRFGGDCTPVILWRSVSQDP